MRRDRLSILVLLTALLAVGLVAAALVAPSGAADAGDSADQTSTVDMRGSVDAEQGHDPGATLPATALEAVPRPWRHPPP